MLEHCFKTAICHFIMSLMDELGAGTAILLEEEPLLDHPRLEKGR